MTSSDKLLERMRNNPRDWRIEDLERIAKQFGIQTRKPGGSHVVFTHTNWIQMLCVPAHRPIKPIYIKKFLLLIDELVGTK
jgi:hypothetical protein